MNNVVKKHLPKNWAWATMDQIADVIGGGTPKSKEKRFYDGGDIPWLTPADLSGYKDKYITNGARFITEEGLSSSSAKMMPPGTILFTSRAPIGYVVIAKNEICTNQGFKSFVLKSEDILPDYVYWWLKGSKQLAESFASGTTFLELSGSKAKKLPIPIAPLEQQKRIVAKIEELFSHIDAGIEALKKAKQLLKQYRQSVLKAAVTGELTKEWREQNRVSNKTWRSLILGDIATIIDPNPSHRYPPYDDGDVPLMATKQMKGVDGWDESTAKQTTTEFYEQRKDAHGFDDDDIIFARKGRLGLARRPPKIERYAFSHTLFIVRGNNEVVSSYLLWFLRRDEAVGWLLREMNVGAGVPTLGKGIFQNLPIELPSLEEQAVIAQQVEAKLLIIERTEQSIEQQLLKSENHKQSILSSAFSGHLG